MSPNCVAVGTTNSDIAGLGIVIALAFQGGISVLLSVWLFLTADIMLIVSVRKNWLPQSTKPVAPAELEQYVLRDLNIDDDDGSVPRLQGNRPAEVAVEVHGNQAGVQNSASDDGSPGAPSTQRNNPPANVAELQERQSGIRECLTTISDSQLLTGIGLLIAALATRNHLSLYHFHIIYDITNFTAVSFCAALAHSDLNGYILRGLIAIVFSGLYLTFAVFFGSALQRWDYAAPGRCYHTHLIATSTATHPYVDRIYLIITCLYMLIALILSIFPTLSGMPLNPLALLPFEHIHTTGPVPSDDRATWVKAMIKQNGWPVWVRKEVYRGVVLVIALLQYPLHLYSAIALRISNEDFLDGESEGEWSFGQVMALMLVADTIIKCGTAIYKYVTANKSSSTTSGWNWRRERPIPIHH